MAHLDKQAETGAVALWIYHERRCEAGRCRLKPPKSAAEVLPLKRMPNSEALTRSRRTGGQHAAAV